MRQATLIYNPQAGPANLFATVELVADYWRTRGWQVAVQPTRAPGHATELARQAAADGQRMVLAAGGDGTLGEVANGLAGTSTVMAPLPAGTANSFAIELQMPRPNMWSKHKLLQAAESLAAGRVHNMDLGYAVLPDGESRHWLLWAGIGADGYLVDRLEPRPKWSKKMGRVGYSLLGLSAARDLPDFRARVVVDGREIADELLLIVVCNCRRYAGGELLISPHAQLDDGLFEVWLFRGAGILKGIQDFLVVWQGRHLDHPDIELVHGRHVLVETDPVMPCQTDGERAGQSPLNCELRPGALKLLVPDTAPDDLFSGRGEELE